MGSSQGSRPAQIVQSISDLFGLGFSRPCHNDFRKMAFPGCAPRTGYLPVFGPSLPTILCDGFSGRFLQGGSVILPGRHGPSGRPCSERPSNTRWGSIVSLGSPKVALSSESERQRFSRAQRQELYIQSELMTTDYWKALAVASSFARKACWGHRWDFRNFHLPSSKGAYTCQFHMSDSSSCAFPFGCLLSRLWH